MTGPGGFNVLGLALAAITGVFSIEVEAWQQPIASTGQHEYAKASDDAIRRHFTELRAANRIPEFGPLYLKPGERRVVTQGQIDGAFVPGAVRFAEGITIDGTEIVAQLYVLPIVEVKPGQFGGMAFMTIIEDGDRKDEFVVNGIFSSTVDIESVNCRIATRRGKLWQDSDYIPRGTYLWHIGKRGAWLTGGKLTWKSSGVPNLDIPLYDTNPQYMIVWEQPLQELPTGTFISILRMRPMEDVNAGFELGGSQSATIVPIGPDTGKVHPKPLVRLRVKGEKTGTAPVLSEKPAVPTPQQSEPVGAVVTSRPTNANNDAAQSAIDRIRRSRHATMPEPEKAHTTGPMGRGMTIENGTSHNLRIYFSGSISRIVDVAPGASESIELMVGHYDVAAEVPNSAVVPFYGKQTYETNTHYWLRFAVARAAP